MTETPPQLTFNRRSFLYSRDGLTDFRGAMKICSLAGMTWAFVASAVLGARPPPNGTIDGTWKFEYACEGAAGVYGDRCAAGDRDDFTVSIFHSGRKFCGWYQISAELGNHVDAGDLTDWSFNPTSDHATRVHFHRSGTVGEAVIRLAGNEMRWRVLNQRGNEEQSRALVVFASSNGYADASAPRSSAPPCNVRTLGRN